MAPRSLLWEYFTKVSNIRAKCDFCSTTLNTISGREDVDDEVGGWRDVDDELDGWRDDLDKSF